MKKRVKLRDMTQDQKDSFCQERKYCSKCPFNGNPNKEGLGCLKNVENEFLSKDVLSEEIEIEVPDILTGEEREYLKAAVKPYRGNPGLYATRRAWATSGENVVAFSIPLCAEPILMVTPTETMDFMGMEAEVNYSLRELGL